MLSRKIASNRWIESICSIVSLNLLGSESLSALVGAYFGFSGGVAKK